MSRQPYLLQTRRLGMRRYDQDDVEALRGVFADPYAAMFYPAMKATAALQRWINWNLQNYGTHGFGLWALELLDTGTFIGDAGITYQNRRISITMLNKRTEEALRANGMER